MTTKFKFLTLLILAGFAVSTTSCYFDFDDDDDDIFGCEKGAGSTEVRDLTIQDFHSISLEIPADVYIRQGNDFSVRAEGQDNILDLIETDVDNGLWEIEFSDCVRDFQSLKIYITMPEIDKLVSTATGDIYGENLFQIDDLVLLSTGTGNMELDLDADDVEASCTGTGDIRLYGICDDLHVVLTGTGDFEGFQLKAQTADVRTTGTGDAEVNVENRLKVSITGSGDVSYKGNPLIESTITGTGRLINAN